MGEGREQAEAVEDFSRVVRWVEYRQQPETAPLSAQLGTFLGLREAEIGLPHRRMPARQYGPPV